MGPEEYLKVGRCPNCGMMLNAYGCYMHCHTCNSTWEGYSNGMWAKVTGWEPPTEKEINEHFEHYTSYSDHWGL